MILVVALRSKNICKFIPQDISPNFTVSCFVLESDEGAMSLKKRLSSNRVILVIKGKGNFFFDNKRIGFESGSLIFGFSGEEFFAECEEKTEYMYIDFSGVRSDELFRRFNITSYNRSFGGLDGIIPLWHESLSRASEATIDLASESILLYTFSRLFGNISASNGIIDEIIEYTEENFTDSELSVVVVAEHLGYNAKYISHVFKAKKGVGYTEYLRSLRIKYAVSLFEHGIDSVKNVALLSGFTDPLYFSTVFKNNIGVSPKDYRNRKTKN